MVYGGIYEWGTHEWGQLPSICISEMRSIEEIEDMNDGLAG